MNKGLFALAALGASMIAGSADAVVLSYQVLNGNTVIGSGSNGLGGSIAVIGSDPIFTLVSGTASSAPALTSPNFSNNNFILSTNGLASPATLTIKLTATGLDPFSGQVSNTFTLNSLTAGSTFTTGTIANYFDATNAAYGTGTLLGTSTFNGIDSFSEKKISNVNMSSVFSETTVYTLNFKAGSSSSLSSSSQLIGSAVPEPATWSMMLVGFGALGLGLRRRQRVLSA